MLESQHSGQNANHVALHGAFAMSIRTNTIFLTAASIVQKGISFFYFVILAQQYGAQAIGQYSYALACTTIFSILIDGGLTPVLIRTIARGDGEVFLYLRRFLKIKIGLLLITLIGITLVIFGIDRAREVWVLICAGAVVMIIDSINLTLFGVLRGFQNLKFESVGIICAQIISFTIGIIAAYQHASIVFPVIGLSIGSMAHLGFAVFGLRRVSVRVAGAVVEPTGLSVQVAPSPSLRILAREAAPFFLAGIFARGYSFLDVVILGAVSFTASGLYSVPNKLTYAFQFIPLSLAASLYPAFSKLLHEDVGAAASRWRDSQRYLLCAVIFIVSAVIALSRRLLGFYGSEFQVAEVTLIILSISLLFSFISYPTGALLNAAGKQHLQTIAMGCTFFSNAALNFILIPRLGPVGAAISAVAGNLILFSIGLWYAHTRVLILPWKEVLYDAVKILMLGLITGICIKFSSMFLPWFVAGSIGAVIYAALICYSGIVSYTDVLQFVWQRFKKI